MIKIDEEYTEVSIKANVNAIKFWALQYGGVATVLKPESLRKELLNTIEEMQNRYMNQFFAYAQTIWRNTMYN